VSEKKGRGELIVPIVNTALDHGGEASSGENIIYWRVFNIASNGSQARGYIILLKNVSLSYSNNCLSLHVA
jgi:hypothetical protein